MGTTRYIYNKCVDALRTHTKDSPRLGITQLRERFMNKGSEEAPAWIEETPYDVRDTAIRDVMKARQHEIKKYRKTGKNFTLHFRTKHDRTQCIDVLKKHWGKTRGVFSSIFHASKLKQARKNHTTSRKRRRRWKLPETLPCDSKMVLDRLGRFYLCVVMPRERRASDSESQTVPVRRPIAAIDPGVRTFGTVYTGDRIIHWGKDAQDRVFKLCRGVDKLVSLRARCNNHRERFHYTRAIIRHHTHIQQLVAELHRKFARYLVDTFDEILLPSFDTKQMVSRDENRSKWLRSDTARAMCTFSHYKFRQRILHSASETGSVVRIVNEFYTSRTCGNCGNLHPNLGGAKIYNCPHCHVRMGRDANGARNILLRHLTIT